MEQANPTTILFMAAVLALGFGEVLRRMFTVSVEREQLAVDRQEVNVRADETFLALFNTQNARLERLETQNLENMKRNNTLLERNHSLELENSDLRRKVEVLETKVEAQAAEIEALKARLAKYEMKENA